MWKPESACAHAKGPKKYYVEDDIIIQNLENYGLNSGLVGVVTVLVAAQILISRLGLPHTIWPLRLPSL